MSGRKRDENDVLKKKKWEEYRLFLSLVPPNPESTTAERLEPSNVAFCGQLWHNADYLSWQIWNRRQREASADIWLPWYDMDDLGKLNCDPKRPAASVGRDGLELRLSAWNNRVRSTGIEIGIVIGVYLAHRMNIHSQALSRKIMERHCPELGKNKPW